MTDSRRLTTDRFYGGTKHRRQLLAQFLSYIIAEEPSEREATEWLVTYTNAQSRDATGRHLNFLLAIDLIERTGDRLSLGPAGEEWLETWNPQVLFRALHENVAGFETILAALLAGPRPDAELMTALNEAGPFDMESPGVAARHREWLQVLGYIHREGEKNQLTGPGQALAAELGLTGKHPPEDEGTGIIGTEELQDTLNFEPGQRYDREAIHEAYGGAKYRGIATPADTPIVLLFTGESGDEHGYEDGFKSDGAFLYTGEGQEGDMNMERGNAAIRDHKPNGEELHLFESLEGAWVVRYIGQFEYIGHDIEELPDTNGKLREAFRFELQPIGETASLH